jgi:hypothetical protein
MAATDIILIPEQGESHGISQCDTQSCPSPQEPYGCSVKNLVHCYGVIMESVLLFDFTA